jgi:ribosomal-protein-alanine N-acetyltransferase
MQVDDVPSVFDIERDSFNDSSWTIDAFYHELNENNFPLESLRIAIVVI